MSTEPDILKLLVLMFDRFLTVELVVHMQDYSLVSFTFLRSGTEINALACYTSALTKEAFNMASPRGGKPLPVSLLRAQTQIELLLKGGVPFPEPFGVLFCGKEKLQHADVLKPNNKGFCSYTETSAGY